MALGIYKPGQGYWTRVLTAVGLGVVILAGVAWLWGQIKTIPVERTSWEMEIAAVQGAPAPGMRVELFADDRGETKIGSASVKSVDASGKKIVVDRVERAGKADAGSTRRLQATQGAAGALGQQAEFTSTVTGRRGIAAFDILYLQAGVAGALTVLAAGVLYWLLAIRPGPNEFLISVDAEMRKVNWSTRREVYGSTVVVLVVFLTITLLILAVDTGFASLFRKIGVLGI